MRLLFKVRRLPTWRDSLASLACRCMRVKRGSKKNVPSFCIRSIRSFEGTRFYFATCLHNPYPCVRRGCVGYVRPSIHYVNGAPPYMRMQPVLGSGRGSMQLALPRALPWRHQRGVRGHQQRHGMREELGRRPLHRLQQPGNLGDEYS